MCINQKRIKPKILYQEFCQRGKGNWEQSVAQLHDTLATKRTNGRGDDGSVYHTLWWAIVDSNHRPRPYQDRALTN